MDIRNILVPVDFSPASKLAVDFAVPFARKCHARLTIMHVLAANDIERKQDSEAILHELSKTVSPDGKDGLDVQTRIRSGILEDEIRTAIEDEFVGIVVMGMNHHGLIRSLLIGSVAEGILRTMPVPLLTVPSHARSMSLSHFLFPTDLTESSREGFRLALELARTFDTNLILHHSIEPIPISYGGSLPIIDDPTNRQLLIDEARRKLSEFESEGGRTGVPVVSKVTEGVASDKILAVSEETGAGLIVLTIHDKGLLERALLGSTAERIIREARVPVLSVPMNNISNPIEEKVASHASIPDLSAMP